MSKPGNYEVWVPAVRRAARKLADEFDMRDLRAQITEHSGPRDYGGHKSLNLYAKLEPNDVHGLRPYSADLRGDPKAFSLLVSLRSGRYRTANRMYCLT